MTEADLQRLRTIIEAHIAETRSSLPYLAEESKAVEPNVSLGCGKDIPMGRLEVVPEAFVCVECASRPR